MENRRFEFPLTPQASKNCTQETGIRYSKMQKKIIGDYFYYLSEQLGCGFTSQVFKCYKKQNKDNIYAIKVINLQKLSRGAYSLLQNQIKILKELDHPNVVKFHQVYNTKNNCYIITDYCEGGTLLNRIESKLKVDWQPIFWQLLQGCAYLQQKLVIHRDLKPANIFLKGETWKIGDFGFARYVAHKMTNIKEAMVVGSRLYMSPQTFEQNIYSFKTDSFALGVMLFQLITKQFPWKGKTYQQLSKAYSQIQFPIQKLAHVPESIGMYMKGLCDNRFTGRFYISDYQSLLSQIQRSTVSSVKQNLIGTISSSITLNFIEKIKLCKFVYYIQKNIQHFPQMNQISTKIRQVMIFLFLVFGWDPETQFNKYFGQFCYSSYKIYSHYSQLQQCYLIFQKQARQMKLSVIPRVKIAALKLEEFLTFLGLLIDKNYEGIKQVIEKMILNPDFSTASLSFLSKAKTVSKTY